jgi:hypothetical protein
MADLLLETVHPVSEVSAAGALERPPTGAARAALYVVEGTEADRRAWFVVRVRPERRTAFHSAATNGGHFDLPAFGDVLASGWLERGGPEAGVAYALQRALPDLEPELVLARAARIVSGDTKPSDFLSLEVVAAHARGPDASIPDDVRAKVCALARELNADPLPASDDLHLTTDLLLRRFYAPQPVLCRRTDEGALVLAVGFEQIGPVFARVPDDALRGYVTEFLDDSFS